MKFIKYLSLVVVAGITAFLVYTLNRGFDFTDEGFYLIKMKQGASDYYDVFTFQKVAEFLFGGLSITVENVRLIRLLLGIFASIVMAFATYQHFKKADFSVWQKNKTFFISFLILGGYVSYGFGPMSLSYNSLTGSLIVIALSLALLGNMEEKLSISRLYVALAGVVSFFVLISKVPSGLVFCFVLLSWFVLLKRTLLERIYLIIFYVFGFLLMGMIYHFTYSSLLEDYMFFNEARRIIQAGAKSYSTGGQLSGFLDLIKMVIVAGVISSLIYLIFYYFEDKFKSSRRLYLITIILISLIGLAYYPISKYNFLIIPLFISFFILIAKTYHLLKHRLIELIFNFKFQLIVVFLIAPFVTVLGTSVSMFNSSNFTLTTWFFLVIIMNTYKPKSLLYKIPFLLAITLAFVYVINNAFIHPYRQQSLWEQSQKFTYNENKIFVDNESYSFLSDIALSLEQSQFQKNDTVLGLTKLSSIIYLFDGIDISGGHWGGKTFTTVLLKNLKDSDGNFKYPKFIFVRLNEGDELHQETTVQILSQNGYDFSRYQHITDVGKIPNQHSFLHIYRRIETEKPSDEF